MTLAIVGGYRLVRRVGQGARADVWLGHPVDGEDAAAVAVKLFHPATSSHSISAEIEALARAAGPHVVAVVDITTSADDRTALILERLGPHTLASVLAARSALRAGEAVTILTPVLEAVTRFHAAGVAHEALRASAIGFTQNGAPVVMSFGSVTVVHSGASTPVARASDPGMTADSRALVGLCRDVVGPIPGSSAVMAWLDDHGGAPDWMAAFVPRLFAWAVPEPLDFGLAESALTPIVAPAPLRPRERVSLVRSSLDTISHVLSADGVEWIRRHARTVRPRFWVAGGVVAAALVVAVALVPAPASDALSATPSPAPTESMSGPQDDAVRGDDPVAALGVLLDTRDGCIRDLSVLCLDAVAQPGSTALALDQQLIRGLQEGAEAPSPLEDREIVLEESLGGTALLAVSASNAEPASILVMRSEAGWRIRDYLDGG